MLDLKIEIKVSLNQLFKRGFVYFMIISINGIKVKLNAMKLAKEAIRTNLK